MVEKWVISETRKNECSYGGWVDRMEGGGRGRRERRGDLSTHMTHSTTPSLLHWTHLNTERRPVRFFLATFLDALERMGGRERGNGGKDRGGRDGGTERGHEGLRLVEVRVR